MPPVTGNKPLTFESVSPRVTVAIGPVQGDRAASNSTIIVGDEATLVADTMVSPQLMRQAKERAEELGGRSVAYVFNTHGDPDHLLGNGLFEDAVVVAHRSVAELLADPQRRQAYQDRLENADGFKLRPPDETFEDRHEFELGGISAEATYVGPAHSVGDSILWLPEERVLVAADVVFNGLFPLIRDDVARWMAALTMALELDPAVVVPGHGPVGDADTLRWQRDLLSAIESVVKERYAAGVPLESAKGSAVPSDFATLPLAADRWPGAVSGVYATLDEVSSSA